MKILHNNQVDDATITASSEESEYPASNVAHIHLVRIWRSTGDTSENIVLDLGAATEIDGFAIVAHNLTAAATVRVQANSSDSWGAPPVDELMTWNAGIIWKILASSEIYRYWRFTFADAANPDGYIEVGRLVLSLHFDPGELPGADYQETLNDDSLIFESLSRQIYADQRTKYLTAEISMATMTEATRQNLITFFDAVRIYTPFVFIADENNTDKIEPLYCVLDRGPTLNQVGAWAWRDDKLQFRETF